MVVSNSFIAFVAWCHAALTGAGYALLFTAWVVAFAPRWFEPSSRLAVSQLLEIIAPVVVFLAVLGLTMLLFIRHSKEHRPLLLERSTIAAWLLCLMLLFAPAIQG